MYYNNPLVASDMLPLQHPATVLKAGPSRAGKTCFLTKLLKHKDNMFTVKFNYIVWCYGGPVENIPTPNIKF